jgi:hypothetical protein
MLLSLIVYTTNEGWALLLKRYIENKKNRTFVGPAFWNDIKF